MKRTGRQRTYQFSGLGVSGGVVFGPAFVLELNNQETECHPVAPEEVEAEVARFLAAVEQAKVEVTELARAVTRRLDAQQAAIFDAHVTLLGDPLLLDRTLERIREEHCNAEYIFWGVTRDIGAQLSSLGDSYFTERTHDLYDIARRVLKFLREIKNPGGVQMPEGAIIVAEDLGPSETAQLRRDKIAGFCTNSGGPTSHTAIMAKALLLPAVVGLDFITHYVRTGDTVILDGTEGRVILNPTPALLEEYARKAEALAVHRDGLRQMCNLPAITTDGVRVSLEANIEFADEVDEVLSQGADGIGLYRTEYFFIERNTLPTNEEQRDDYRRVMDGMGDAPVVFRTLDVGGDKLAASVATAPESNPFLGLRALRLCLANPELFRLQLRPLLEAGSGRELRILLPMVSNVDEVEEARRHIDAMRLSLQSKRIEPPTTIHVGAMIEIPSAALQAHQLAEYVDFFSIGTNDLTQYTLAVDRVNKLVGHLYQETHPAVLHLIRNVVRAGEDTGTPVTVCGEMAGDPMLAMLLVGMGVRSLSMSPMLIGPVKQSLRQHSAAELQSIAEEALQLPKAKAIRRCLQERLRGHTAPSHHPSGIHLLP